ncbi:unnamed protein product [Protopolystoma xenopodis]|uniref:Uncharacterized protein n=1 Tax=Protopolystoma xenopodis TaxID=117903 RepID=A0A448WLU6_9PLAT|nr:unnamed protein product [Protopolystoma xenopodis]
MISTGLPKLKSCISRTPYVVMLNNIRPTDSSAKYSYCANFACLLKMTCQARQLTLFITNCRAQAPSEDPLAVATFELIEDDMQNETLVHPKKTRPLLPHSSFLFFTIRNPSCIQLHLTTSLPHYLTPFLLLHRTLHSVIFIHTHTVHSNSM